MCPSTHPSQAFVWHFVELCRGSARVLPARWCQTPLCPGGSSAALEKKKAIDCNRARMPCIQSRARQAIFLLQPFLQTAVSYRRSLSELQAGSFICSLIATWHFKWGILFPPFPVCPAAAFQRGKEESISLCRLQSSGAIYCRALVALGKEEGNGPSKNLKIIRALGLLLGYSRDLSHQSADGGLDI